MVQNKDISSGLFPKWKKQIDVFNNAIKVLEMAKSLADKFDGKVINKRFKDALNEMAKNDKAIFSIEEKGYDYRAKINEKRLKFSITDRSFPTSKCTCGYVDESDFDVREINAMDFYINADGRLVKDIFIQAVDKEIENIKNRLSDYQDCIDNFDTYLDEVRKINNEIDELRKKVHYPMLIMTYKLELPFWY